MLSQCLINQTLRHEGMREMRYSFTIFDFGTGWSGVVSCTLPDALSQGELSPLSIGWVGLRTGLDAEEKRKASYHSLESKPDRSAHTPLLNRLSYQLGYLE